MSSLMFFQAWYTTDCSPTFLWNISAAHERPKLRRLYWNSPTWVDNVVSGHESEWSVICWYFAQLPHHASCNTNITVMTVQENSNRASLLHCSSIKLIEWICLSEPTVCTCFAIQFTRDPKLRNESKLGTLPKSYFTSLVRWLFSSWCHSVTTSCLRIWSIISFITSINRLFLFVKKI